MVIFATEVLFSVKFMEKFLYGFWVLYDIYKCFLIWKLFNFHYALA